MTWWQAWRATRRPVVILFTRQGCHPCHDAQAVLAGLRASIDFDLALIDIDQDPESRRLYDLEVPVLSIDGRVRFRGGVDAFLLRRELLAAARG